MRRAVTLVEVAVASAIFLALLGVLWALPLMGRRAEKAGERDGALAASLLAQERIEQDLARVAPATAHRPALEVAPDGRSIRLLLADRPATGTTATSEVAYAIEDRNGTPYLVRTEGAHREVLAGPYLRNAHFEMAWTPVGWMLRARFQLDVERRAHHAIFARRVNLPG